MSNTKDRRKELVQQYKDIPVRKGVYRITNRETGRILFGSSVNLAGAFNLVRFGLQTGLHQNKQLQEDWNRIGEDGFRFEILEELKPLESGLPRKRKDELELLEAMEKRWGDQLRPDELNSY